MRFRILRAAGLVAVAALQIPWLLQPIPVALKLAHVAFVALAIARPAVACLVLAGLGPLAHSILEMLSVPIAGTRLLEQMVLGVITGAIVRQPSGAAPTRTGLAATVMGLVTLAAAAAVIPGRLMTADTAAFTWTRILHLWQGHHFNPDAVWAPCVIAMYTAEGMALLWAIETIVRRDRQIVARVVLAALASHALAALLNAAQVWTVAAQSTAFVTTFFKPSLLNRVSLQYDQNAAGSVFVLVTLAGLALFKRPWWRQLAVVTMLSAVLLGIWLSGSRAALGACVMVPVAMGFIEGFRRRKLIGFAAVGGLVVAASLYVAFYPSGPAFDHDRGTIQSRLVMTKTALRAARRAPVFGLGPGGFYEQSVLFGAFTIENAHNTVLQVVADEGIVGLGALLVLLTAVLAPVIRTRDEPPDITRRWLAAGVAGFLLSGVLGHPLLEPDAAFMFWMVLGMVAGLTPAPAPSSRRIALAAIAAAALVVSVPFRIQAENMRQTGVGLSAWRSDASGLPYRQGGTTFALYLPANQPVLLPLRVAGSSVIGIDVQIDGRVVAVVTVTDAWQKILLRLPSQVWGYRRVDFVASPTGPGTPASATIEVGVPEVR